MLTDCWLLAEEQALRFYIAVDGLGWLLVPADVEGAKLWKKLELAVGQVIVDPIGQTSPVGSCFVLVCEPRDDDAGHGTFVTLGIAFVPDVRGKVALVGAAVVLPFVTQLVHCR